VVKQTIITDHITGLLWGLDFSPNAQCPMPVGIPRGFRIPTEHEPFIFFFNAIDDIARHRSFAAAGQRLWNTLPSTLRQTTSYGQFRRHLKAYLFRAYNSRCMVMFDFFVLYRYSYLLTYLKITILLSVMKKQLLPQIKLKIRLFGAIQSSNISY